MTKVWHASFTAMAFCTAGELVAGYDANRLSELKRPWGAKQQKVGKKADRILLNAEVLTTKQERLLASPVLPASENFVMFDLEGLAAPA